MLDGEVLFPVIGQALVERAILVSSDILGVPRPDGLCLVELLVLNFNLLDLLLLLRLVLVVVIDLLDLGLLLALLAFLLDFFLVVLDLLKNNQISMLML